MAAGNYTVDLENNPGLQLIKTEENTALTNDAKDWDDRITESDEYFDGLIENSNKYAEDQKSLVEDQTEFAIDQIEQQKAQTEKDYVKEQSGAYVDWQKQSNEYGVNAERRASMGMTGTGYSESSKVSMYNAYQNRVAVARQSFDNAVLNFNNAIREAQLQNDSKLAEIAYETLQTEIELSLQKFQYRNDLIFKKVESQQAIRDEYSNKWKTVLDQINTENAIAEEQRQFDEEMQFAREQAELNSGVGVIDKGTGVGSPVDTSYANNQASYISIEKEAAAIKSNKTLGVYLDQLVSAGYITEAQADNLYEKYYDLSNSTWTLEDNGGINWFGGIDNNAKVKDENGNVYTLSELKNALIKQGWSKDKATVYITGLQKRLKA